MSKAHATATYRDIWAGDVSAELVSFRTKRRGETVTRYRWRGADGLFIHRWVSPFQTVAGAVAAAEGHACFASVAAA